VWNRGNNDINIFFDGSIVVSTSCPNACSTLHRKQYTSNYCPASRIGQTPRAPSDLLTSLNHQSYMYININHRSIQSRPSIPFSSSEQKITQIFQLQYKTLTMPPTPK
jgi:hypothetical protein